MGKNWQCEYKIQNPDTKMKIMIEWKYFDLADCHLQNVTVVDWKTKNAVGPYCGTETPPLYLSAKGLTIAINLFRNILKIALFYVTNLQIKRLFNPIRKIQISYGSV